MGTDKLAERIARQYLAAEKESTRLKGLQKELRDMSARLAEIVDECAFDPSLIKKLPKEYKSKSNQADFPKAPDMAQKASTAVQSIARALDMGVVLAEVAEGKD